MPSWPCWNGSTSCASSFANRSMTVPRHPGHLGPSISVRLLVVNQPTSCGAAGAARSALDDPQPAPEEQVKTPSTPIRAGSSHHRQCMSATVMKRSVKHRNTITSAMSVGSRSRLAWAWLRSNRPFSSGRKANRARSAWSHHPRRHGVHPIRRGVFQGGTGCERGHTRPWGGIGRLRRPGGSDDGLVFTDPAPADLQMGMAAGSRGSTLVKLMRTIRSHSSAATDGGRRSPPALLHRIKTTKLGGGVVDRRVIGWYR